MSEVVNELYELTTRTAALRAGNDRLASLNQLQAHWEDNQIAILQMAFDSVGNDFIDDLNENAIPALKREFVPAAKEAADYLQGDITLEAVSSEIAALFIVDTESILFAAGLGSQNLLDAAKQRLTEIRTNKWQMENMFRLEQSERALDVPGHVPFY